MNKETSRSIIICYSEADDDKRWSLVVGAHGVHAKIHKSNTSISRDYVV
jgi:hypothetical protein